VGKRFGVRGYGLSLEGQNPSPGIALTDVRSDISRKGEVRSRGDGYADTSNSPTSAMPTGVPAEQMASDGGCAHFP